VNKDQAIGLNLEILVVPTGDRDKDLHRGLLKKVWDHLP
jgi:hypothetical protein